MGIRTGSQYLDGLRDGRHVWLAGERVQNVTEHPSLAGLCDSVARLYDMQHDPLWTDVITEIDADLGERVSVAFCPPRSSAELAHRGVAFGATAAATFGMMGRSPDFLNTAVTAFSCAAGFFGESDPQFADNIVNYYEYCRRNDPFLAHATINPATNRARASHQQDSRTAHLRVVGETAEGLVFRGAKMIGTLVPIADELVVFPLPGYQPGDEAYTAAFAIPVNTDGLHVVCREPFGGSDARNPLDHPLAKFDEIDATVVFEDVIVPWERVFFRGHVDAANSLYDVTTARHHTGHHGAVRGVAKAELLVGLSIGLAESAGTSAFPHVQQMLGEAIGLLELSRGAVLLAEQRATASRWGLATPDMSPIQALRYHFPRFCARLVEIIQLLGGGSLLSVPTVADLQLRGGPDIRPYFRGSTTSAQERVRLLKLAWDASGDSIGQRQMQYERYHAGDPFRLAALHYATYDRSGLNATIARALREE